MRARRTRMSRYVFRTPFRNSPDTMTTNGMTANDASARRQSMMSIATLIATSVKRSPRPETTPAVNSSFRVSTSEVTRVMSRPAGFLSKNATDNRCRCSKISILRSRITRWPSRLVSQVCV